MEARVGPNAIIQLGDVLRDRCGLADAERVFGAAGLSRYLTRPPYAMVSEGEAAALHRALQSALPDRASDLATDAGSRTADYLLAHRIPAAAQHLLRLLPAPLAARLLVKAISRHAWTFAGSGSFAAAFGKGANNPPLVISIRANPLATPGCPWHRAVFTRLFSQLVSPRTLVVHDHCCAAGDPTCRFVIDWHAEGSVP